MKKNMSEGSILYSMDWTKNGCHPYNKRFPDVTEASKEKDDKLIDLLRSLKVKPTAERRSN